MTNSVPGTAPAVTYEDWAIEQALRPMLEAGWEREAAAEALNVAMRRHLDAHARAQGVPEPLPVPSPVACNGDGVIHLPDRDVQLLARLRVPPVVLFGNLLSAEECDAFIALARPELRRSETLNLDTGVDEANQARSSEGVYFQRGQHPLCQRIEARLAALLDWPVERGEGLQVLRYGPGAEYQPHYDYFDPARPGTAATLARGGQRVASMVMYLNTPGLGGATVFPDAGFEVAATLGNGVFFSYDQPHPKTRSLHAGAPVQRGEKWILTKWMRAQEHV